MMVMVQHARLGLSQHTHGKNRRAAFVLISILFVMFILFVRLVAATQEHEHKPVDMLDRGTVKCPVDIVSTLIKSVKAIRFDTPLSCQLQSHKLWIIDNKHKSTTAVQQQQRQQQQQQQQCSKYNYCVLIKAMFYG